MAVKKYGLNGISQNVEYGKRGLRIKSDGTSFQLLSNDELNLVELKAKDGTTSQSLVTKSQLDQKQGNLSIAAGSQQYLDLSGDVLSVKQMMIHDVHVDNVATDLAQFVASNYVVGNEFQEGDIIILMASTDAQKRSFIHNGGSASDTSDFTRMQVDLSDSVIRAMFSAGTGIAYNPATGEISLNASAADISVDSSGAVVLSGSNAMEIFGSIDMALQGIKNDISRLQSMTGMPANASNLGANSNGSTVRENATIKEAINDLESAIELTGDQSFGVRRVDFTYQNDTVNVGVEIPANKIIIDTYVIVDEAFNSATSTVEVGVSGNLNEVMGANESDLQEIGSNVSHNTVLHGEGPTQYIATINSDGATQGSGHVVIRYC